MKKGILIYSLSAVLLILFTGILAMLLGIIDTLPEETNQSIIEIVSGYLGAAFFTCLYTRIRTKQWDKAWDRNRYLHLSVMAFLFFLFRMANRLILGIFLRHEMSGIGYTLSIVADICLPVCLCLCLPKQGSAADISKEKDTEIPADTMTQKTAGEEK